MRERINLFAEQCSQWIPRVGYTVEKGRVSGTFIIMPSTYLVRSPTILVVN